MIMIYLDFNSKYAMQIAKGVGRDGLYIKGIGEQVTKV